MKRGYCKGINDDTYNIEIQSKFGDYMTEDITLGGSPFIISYETSSNIFEPMRKATCTINVVSDTYMTDIYTPFATGTSVLIKKNNEVIFQGFLKTNLYNQGYTNETETIEYEASDSISALQYIQYSGETKSVVTFRYIIEKLFDAIDITKYKVCVGKQIKKNGKFENMKLDDITISEANFYSSDTDEGWSMEEVLQEICKYLGYTCVQIGDCVYFIDYNQIRNDKHNYFYYEKINDEWTLVSESSSGGHPYKDVNKEDIMGNGHSISYETVITECVVNCSTYNIDSFIPSIFDDDNLHNREGDWYKCSYIPASSNKQYVSAKNKATYEEASDSDKVFVHRLLDNDNYESKYYLKNLQPTTPHVYDITTEIISVQNGDGITGPVMITASFTNTGTTSHNIDFYLSKVIGGDETIDYHSSFVEFENTERTSFTINAGQTIQRQLQAQPPIVPEGITNRVGSYSAYYITNGVYCNIGQNGGTEDKDFLGATIVDLASYDRIPKDVYNYEETASLSFNRYLCINQLNIPDNDYFYAYKGRLPYPWEEWVEPEIDYSKHPALFVLKDKAAKPFIFNDKSYISINCNAICERYVGRNYINSEWTKESTAHIKHPSNAWGERALSLIFKLGIGDKFWNGSEWTTTDTCFMVPMSTQVDDKYNIDWSSIWNITFHPLNNFSWEEWTGAEGYRIPLTGVDTSGEITFEIHLPTKLQYYVNMEDTYLNSLANSTLNGYTWLSGLDIKLVGDNEKISDEDIIYKNVIEEESINDPVEIDLRINSYPGEVPLSYSFVGKADGGFLTEIKEEGIYSQLPEENLIFKMTRQYNHPTMSETLVVNTDFTQLDKITDSYTKKEMVIIGQEIDYVNDRQTITCIELK